MLRRVVASSHPPAGPSPDRRWGWTLGWVRSRGFPRHVARVAWLAWVALGGLLGDVDTFADAPIRPSAIPVVEPTESPSTRASEVGGDEAGASERLALKEGPAGSDGNGHAVVDGEGEPSHSGGAEPKAPVASQRVRERLIEGEWSSDHADRAVFESRLEVARRLRREGHPDLAVRDLVTLLRSLAPNDVKRPALLELSAIAEESGQMGRAQQILSQYTKLFPQHPSVVEVYLRQGILYRDMGAIEMALTKFHAVFSSALAQRFDQLDYYRRIVFQAQTEIAETYYLNGRWEEARDFLQRVMKLEASPIAMMPVHYKLLRVLAELGRSEETVAQGNQFLLRYPEVGQVPEVRFLVASALKKLGRNTESLAQVLQLLEAGRNAAKERPEVWAYWQKRAGNDIANQLYQDGDYVGTLEVYRRLAELDGSAGWQLPVWYQIGLVLERLEQTEKAAEVYDRIVARETEVKADAGAATLMVVVEMAKWRKGNLKWMSSVVTNLVTLRPLVTTASPEKKNEPAQ